jgi:hypothetical protein
MHALSTSAVCAHTLSPTLCACSAIDTSTPDLSTSTQRVPNTCMRTQTCFRTHASAQCMLLHCYAAKNSCQICDMDSVPPQYENPCCMLICLASFHPSGCVHDVQKGQGRTLATANDLYASHKDIQTERIPKLLQLVGSNILSAYGIKMVIVNGAQCTHSAAHCMSEVMMWARHMLLCRTFDLPHHKWGARSCLCSSLSLAWLLFGLVFSLPNATEWLDQCNRLTT